jgi:hypothetical protein
VEYPGQSLKTIQILALSFQAESGTRSDRPRVLGDRQAAIYDQIRKSREPKSRSFPRHGTCNTMIQFFLSPNLKIYSAH